MAYDPETGQALSASFMDYALPRVDGFRAFKTEFDTSVPCTTNAIGSKGVGELGTIGATPATVLAVLDALSDRGVRDIEMPITPEKIWRVLGKRQ